MKNLSSFILGIREFRCGVTTHFDDASQLYAYDFGRELAHRMTFRRFEQH